MKFNRIFEYPPAEPGKIYSNVVRIMFIGAFYCRLWPISLVLCCINLFLHY